MISGAQVRAARALLNLSQEVLAAEAEITRPTLTNLENGRRVSYDTTFRKVVAVLEARGISFVDNESGVGVVVTRTRS